MLWGMAQPFVEPCDRGIIAAQPCPRALGREIAPRQRRMVLAACVLASSMAFIDGSALTVALPKLRAYFGAERESDLTSLRLMRFMSDFREAMWGVLQSGISELDFDFIGYARNHFTRMQATASDPSFNTFLRTGGASEAESDT